MPSSAAPARLFEPAGAMSRSAGQKLRHALYASKPYGLMLRGRHPVTFKHIPQDPWPGSPKTADALFRGDYVFAGARVSAPNENPWRLIPPSRAWAEELHGFSWLRHFSAQGGEAAQRHVETLIRLWLDDFSDWHAFAWRPEIIAHRLIAWIRNAAVTANTQDLIYHSTVMGSIARQARHLQRTANDSEDGLPRLIAAVGLVYAGVCLPNEASRLARGLIRLESEMARLILADGGLITRSPSDQLAALEALGCLRHTLRDAGHAVPPSLQAAIDRIAPMVRFFRHDDGSLALFNGGFAEDRSRIDGILSLADAAGQPVQGAIHSGFQRIEAGEMVLIMDAGEPPQGALSTGAHVGLSSFEFSAAGHRVVTNCGSSEQITGSGYKKIGRATAAHSTLIVNDFNACGILPNERIGRRPKKISVKRVEDADGVRIETSHDGYGTKFGLVHRRVLRVAADGSSVIGSDQIERLKARRRGNLPFDVRFHLHPEVSVERLDQAASVSLVLPDGQTWRFDSHGGRLGVEESVFFGERSHPRKTRQLVLSGTTEAGTTEVQWRFAKVVPFSLEP